MIGINTTPKKIKVTVGQLLVNEALPPDIRNYSMVLDADGISKLFSTIARRYPDKYPEILKNLSDIGRKIGYISAGMSFGVDDITRDKNISKKIEEIEREVKKIYGSRRLSDEEKYKLATKFVSEKIKEVHDNAYKALADAENPLVMQAVSGVRGGKSGVVSLLIGDLMYENNEGRLLPFVISKTFSQGLTPAQYWASTYTGRKGLIGTKLSTQKAGELSKRMSSAMHRLLVTAIDDQYGSNDPPVVRGLPVSIDDSDIVGDVLAVSTGGYKRNTVLTPRIIEDLKRKGYKELLVRNVMVGGPPDGGIYAMDAGYREKGGLPPIGDWIGLAAAQALSEPVTQGVISSKHGSGVTGTKTITFKELKQLLYIPEIYPGGAVYSTVDGKVEKIEPSELGGYFVTISGSRFYVPKDRELNVKVGQEIEAGDAISSGIPNPSIIVKYKGIGEGRRYLAKTFREFLKNMNVKHHARNVYLLARGAIDHVVLNDDFGDNFTGEIINYNYLESRYKPRGDSVRLNLDDAKGMYLEQPVLHYTIGTKVRPSVINELKKFGVNKILVNKNPPPFEPVMLPLPEVVRHDPDWMTQMLGTYLEPLLLKATVSGGTSDLESTSFVPPLAEGSLFGRTKYTKSWDPKNVIKVDLEK